VTTQLNDPVPARLMRLVCVALLPKQDKVGCSFLGSKGLKHILLNVYSAPYPNHTFDLIHNRFNREFKTQNTFMRTAYKG